MSPSPAMTRCAASAIVCRPEEQKRFTVMPGTVCGSPARTAIWRAMFQPVAPSGLAQPMMTSSTSCGSTLARSSAACTTWPPILAPWVLLSAPFQLLQSGVRAVETITASVIEPPAFFSEFDEQRCRLPLRALVSLLEFLDRGEHLVQPCGIGIEHRAAAVRRKAVAREVDHVDVGSAQRDAFLEDVRAFVGEGVDAALDDLVVRDRPRLEAHLFPVGGEHPVHLGIRDGFTVAGLIAIPAAAGLLAEPAFLGDAVGEFSIDEVRALLRAALADFETHVVHGERAHREAPFLQRAVDLLRARALIQHEQALLDVLLEHAVADEAVADAGDHRHLLQCL